VTKQPTADHQIIIAIDGFSGCGKSTLAIDLAKALSYIHIDSGSLYRAISLHFIRNHIDISDTQVVEDALKTVNVKISLVNGKSVPYLDEQNVDSDIRSPKVAEIVSEVAALPQVRHFLIEKQRSFGENKGVIMDGRDIGTVIFPNADLKLFITADIQIRAKRRLLELQERGIESNLQEVVNNLKKRDHIDSTREISPLKKAETAITIDTSFLNREEQLEKAIQLVKKVLNEKR